MKVFSSYGALQHHLAEQARVDALWRAIRNEDQRERRKQLYRDDPLWRLTKLKDNRERRLRAKFQVRA